MTTNSRPDGVRVQLQAGECIVPGEVVQVSAWFAEDEDEAAEPAPRPELFISDQPVRRARRHPRDGA